MDRAAYMGLAESLHLTWSTRTSPPPRSSGRPRGEVRRARIEDRPDFHAVRGVPPGPQRLTMEVLERYQRARAVISGHVYPANEALSVSVQSPRSEEGTSAGAANWV